MTTVEKVLLLKITPPLDRLRDSELGLIASVSQVREYGPHEVIVAAGEPVPRFFVLARGSWTFGGCAHPPTFGAYALLHAHTPAAALEAGPGGATCLTVAASHFHTIVYECPELLLGYLQPAEDKREDAP